MRTWGGFHGHGGNPKQLFSLIQYTEQYHIWKQNGDLGNPLFSQGEITQNELDTAIQFLRTEKPKNVIGYSRGGSIAYLALHSGLVEYKPYVYFLAAAWKKFHNSSPSPSSNLQGVVIHGTDDARVPLRWSLELSILLHLPLIILYKVDHIGNLFLAPFQESILSYARPTPSDVPWKQLPEWTHRLKYGSKKWNKYVRAQRDWVNQYWFTVHPPLIWDEQQWFVPMRKKS